MDQSETEESILDLIDRMPDDLDDRLLFCDSSAADQRRAERARLESECVEYLLVWHTERDAAKRSAAWHRMISAANDLVAFNEANPKE